MKYIKSILAVGMAIALAGCSSKDHDGPEPPVASQDGIYSSISIKLPRSTRSAQKDGEEVGQDFENKIGSILVVLATKEDGDNKPYQFLTFALSDAPTTATDGKYTIVFQDKEALLKQAGKTVYAFAYCNPPEDFVTTVAGNLGADGKYTGGLKDATDKTFTDIPCSTEVEKTWTSNGFLMTSVEVLTAELPSMDELKTYNTPGNAFQLGGKDKAIEVIRTASRFDFRDASEGAAKTGDAKQPLTYYIKDEDGTTVVGNITLTRIAMVNQRGQFYMLPRTLTNGTTTNLCPGFNGMESGHVLSPTANTFTQAMPDVIDPKVARAGDTSYSLKWQSLSAIINGTADNEWSNLTSGVTDPQDYHIWRYTTENTWDYIEETGTDNVIPEDKVPADMNKKTTGFIFEAEIDPIVPDGSDFKKGTDVMFCFNNKLYLGAKAIQAAVAKAPVSTLATAFEKSFDVNAETGAITPKPKTGSDDTYAMAKDMGFIVYEPVDSKYYCYYFGFNRHNDDGKTYQTQDMEFATVRNNVYKIAVTSISKFGTFEAPDKVEEWDTYFKLQIMVRPWVIRINNFDF